MLDLNRTFSLVKGAMFDPDATWDSYLPEAGDWKKTVWLLTGPLIIATGLLSYILAMVFPSRIPFVGSPTLLSMLVGLIGAALGAAFVALVISMLAGLFKGEQSFPKALAATSLAFVPGYAGQILSNLPFIGWLLGLALFVYSLILLWRILPKYMAVPDSARVGHYILSLVGAIAGFVVTGFIATAIGLNRTSVDYRAEVTEHQKQERSTGMFGSMERVGKIIEAAEADEYDPPSDGELSKSQVKKYVDVMTKTAELRKSQTKDLKKLSERAEGGEVESLSEIFSGVGSMMQMTNAEMEVVKTGGGNWAEHLWVKEQLRVAMIQKDINKAVKHNYELYQQFESELRELN